MSKMKILGVLLLLTSFGVPALAQDAVGTALNKCAAITDDASRLICYDALAGVLLNADKSLVTAPAAASASTDAPVGAAVAGAAATGMAPLSDDIGKERVDPTDEDEQPRYSAKVTSCRESAQSGQYYFTFENGQVWKQSNYRNLSMRNCDFDVEISKGTFGFQMYIPSKDRSVRIARVR